MVLFALGTFQNSNRILSEKYGGVSHTNEWAATNFWILSTECAARTHSWLTICQNGNLLPIAAISVADDPGHAFLLDLKAIFRNKARSIEDVARLNIELNLLGLLTVACLFFLVDLHIAAYAFLIVSPPAYFSWIGVSPHSALIGIACCAFAFPCCIFLLTKRAIKKILAVFCLFIALLLLALAMLVREAVGIIGIFASIVAILYFFRFYKGPKRGAISSLLLCSAILGWQSPQILLSLRDGIFNVQPTPLLQAHGFSHNLYIGLGAVPNKFEIQWSDSFAAEAVKKVDPDARYASAEYFSALWRLYFARVLEDPLEIFRIYRQKASIVLSQKLPELSPPLWTVMAITLLFLLGDYIFCFTRKLCVPQLSYFVFLALFFIFFFFLQGVLTHPSANGYTEPIGGFVVLIFSACAEIAARIELKR